MYFFFRKIFVAYVYYRMLLVSAQFFCRGAKQSSPFLSARRPFGQEPEVLQVRMYLHVSLWNQSRFTWAPGATHNCHFSTSSELPWTVLIYSSWCWNRKLQRKTVNLHCCRSGAPLIKGSPVVRIPCSLYFRWVPKVVRSSLLHFSHLDGPSGKNPRFYE